MSSQGYKDWVRAGKPYTLIRPAKALQKTLRGYGFTVYDFPDDSHLLAGTPEDHTPFSVTGFPGSNRRWMARALDVMPRGDSAAGRKELADLSLKLIRDRDAGADAVMWIKYLNWTDAAGTCRQERWTDPGNPLRRTTRSSTDKGHLHISGRSDADTDIRADTYDPLGAPAAAGPRSSQEDSMFLATVKGTTEVWLTNGLFGRWVSAAEYPDVVYLHREGTQPLTFGGAVRELAYQSMVGEVVGQRPDRLGPDSELKAILTAVSGISARGRLDPEDRQAIIDAVIAAPNNRLTQADLALLQEASSATTESALRRVLASVGTTPAA